MIIFSVEQASLSARENAHATAEAEDVLNVSSLGTGVYRGTSEAMFISTQVELGRQLCRDFKQECYLERGHYGYWYLIDTATGNVLESFKTIKEVTKERAEASDCYTILGGKYYLASNY